MAALTNHPDAGPLHLSLAGDGPLDDWRGRLQGEVERLARLDATIDLAYASTRRVGIDGTFTAAPGALPPDLAPVVGNEAKLALHAGKSAPGVFRLDQLLLQAGALSLTGSGTADTGADRLDGRVQLQVPNLATLSGLAGTPLAGQAGLTLGASGRVQEPALRLDLAGSGITAAKATLASLGGGYDVTLLRAARRRDRRRPHRRGGHRRRPRGRRPPARRRPRRARTPRRGAARRRDQARPRGPDERPRPARPLGRRRPRQPAGPAPPRRRRARPRRRPGAGPAAARLQPAAAARRPLARRHGPARRPGEPDRRRPHAHRPEPPGPAARRPGADRPGPEAHRERQVEQKKAVNVGQLRLEGAALDRERRPEARPRPQARRDGHGRAAGPRQARARRQAADRRPADREGRPRRHAGRPRRQPRRHRRRAPLRHADGGPAEAHRHQRRPRPVARRQPGAHRHPRRPAAPARRRLRARQTSGCACRRSS